MTPYFLKSFVLGIIVTALMAYGLTKLGWE